MPEGESAEIKGGTVDYFLKIRGNQAFLKLSASPTLIKGELQGFK